MNKVFCLAIIALLGSLGVLAQPGVQKMSGHVRDSMGQPVAFGSVVAAGCADERILAFATTDENGFYALKFPADCDTVVLTARGLGFQPDTISLLRTALPSTLDFVLSPSDLALREVVVRERLPPVVVRSDTTEFNAAAFSDSTEFSVEDLLRKLPGVRVDGNGQITLNNKPVERVLIEGDDLFSQNYTLATRNLRAGIVSKVQAIDRYQDNPLMKGIQESNRLVLNLVIKDEKKRATSGSAMAGGGYGDDWKGYAHLNLFSLTRRDKIYLIGHADNTGENALRDVEFLGRGGIQGNQAGLQNSPLNAQALLQVPQSQNVGLPPQFTRLNRGGLLYLGQILPFSQTFKVKLSGWAFAENLRQGVNSATRYLLDSATLDITEDQYSCRQGSAWHLQIESEYFAPNQKHAFRYFAKLDGQPDRYTLQIRRSQPGAGPQSFANALTENARQVFGAAEYTWKTNENTALQFALKTTYFDCREMLQSDYAYYALFFGLDSTFKRLRQQIRQNQGQNSLTARLLTRRFRAQWLLESGADWQWGRLRSTAAMLSAADEQWIAPNAYQNDFQVRTPRYFGAFSVTRLWDSWVVQLRLQLARTPFRLTLPALSDSALWTFSPYLNLRYNFNENTHLMMHYNFRQEPPDFTDLYPGYLFADYQTVVRGLPAPALMPGHYAGLTCRHNNRNKQFSWNAGGNLALTDNGLGIQYDINPFLSVQDNFRPLRSSRYTIQAGVDRFFPAINSNIELGLNASLGSTYSKINSAALRRLDTRVYSTYLDYGTAFDSWVNFIFSNQITLYSTRNIAEQTTTTLHTTNWFSSIKITVKPSRMFNASVQTYQVNNRTAGLGRGAWFYAIEGVARLQVPRWRSEAQLSVVNLLNTRRYEQAFADAFFQTNTAIQARARFFLLTWSLDF